MASSSTFPLLFLCLNLLFFALASAGGFCPTPVKPTPKPSPKPSPKPTPKPGPPSCPVDTLKFGGCADVLGVVNVLIGTPPQTPCCSLISGMADADAALCLCTAIKANVLGVNLNFNVDLTVIFNYCGKKVPSGYICA